MSRAAHSFETIRSEGGLLPPDLLRRVLDPRAKVPGTEPEAYGLARGERLNEAITQSWNRLRRHWKEFREDARNLPDGDPGEGLTNDKWSIPVLRDLGFGMLPTAAGPEIAGRTYAIKRFFGATPVHLVGCGVNLDKRAAGVRGAAMSNPHGLVQEFLNRADGYLWAIVSNGLRLRILRDNQALSRQSYLEFDLEAMFDGEVYSDFVLLWLFGHATRFAVREEGKPESCWLEHWCKLAEEQGTRALESLRGGVQEALQILGQGFVGHPKNTALREALRTGKLSLPDFHGQLLRVVYRFIFLFVAEDRRLDNLPLLHPRDGGDAGRLARERYAAFYSTRRLRDMAGRIKGSRHGDLWMQFQLVVGALSGKDEMAGMRESLALPALGSMLWSPESTSDLNAPAAGGAGAELSNYDLLEALRRLAFIRQDKVLRPVDYANLGAEELGGVYEGLLTLTPQVSGDGASFSFAEFAGNRRKTSGSYYTPDSLVQILLDSALNPVIEDAIRGKSGEDAVKAILALKVCDPTVGSGHFLVGAAHRLARHLARVRALGQGESEPSPLLYQHALREVIGHCLYGVDINPMAAELCKVGLWLEAMEPGKALTFLDRHIRVGNALIGTTPDLVSAGLPDEAFTATGDDDKKACTALKRRNAGERAGIGGLFVAEDRFDAAALQQAAVTVDDLPDDRPEDVKRKEEAFRQSQQAYDYQARELLFNTWCAAFVFPKRFDSNGREPIGITRRHLTDIARGRGLPDELRCEVERLTEQYGFFHWHLAFPEVFQPLDRQPDHPSKSWNAGSPSVARKGEGGFDCVLGNPPWERIKLQEQEFFASRSDEIANARNAAVRKKLIASLPVTDPDLWIEWNHASTQAQGESHFARHSGRYPLCGKGDINTYALFAEHNWRTIAPRGRAGFIVPSGIATDDTTKDYFKAIIESGALWSMWEFENEGFFTAGLGHMVRFVLTTLSGSANLAEAADFMFQGHDLAELRDPNRHFRLSADDIETINPNTGTCPIFQTQRDARIALGVYRRAGVLWRENDPDGNPWGLKFMAMFHMANDSGLFRTRGELIAAGWQLQGNRFVKDGETMLPLYEAKMTYIYNHRSGTYEGVAAGERIHRLPSPSEQQLADPKYLSLPFYWVDQREVDAKLQDTWEQGWLLGWRDVTDARASVRTVVASVVPRAAAADTLLLALPSSDPRLVACLCAVLSSIPFDYAARQKVGGLHLKYHVFRQLPAFRPDQFAGTSPWAPQVIVRDWLLPRVLELTYTAWDLQPFAEDCGDSGPPYIWDAARRFQLQCELDAAFFHLYEITREDVDYILDTFPVVRNNDMKAYQEYRTKRVILEIYDALACAAETGQPYVSPLPPPRRAT
jgi:hypothetical protein